MKLEDYLSQFNDFDDTYITYKKQAEQQGMDIGLFNYLVIDRGIEPRQAINTKLEELK